MRSRSWNSCREHAGELYSPGIDGHLRWDELPDEWWGPFAIWKGGMSFHGGFLGVLVAMWLWARRAGKTVVDVYDFIAPLVLLAVGLAALSFLFKRQVTEFRVDPDGRVIDVNLLETSHEEFARSVLDAVERWRFVPGMVGGDAVRFRMRLPVNFRLLEAGEFERAGRP